MSETWICDERTYANPTFGGKREVLHTCQPKSSATITKKLGRLGRARGCRDGDSAIGDSLHRLAFYCHPLEFARGIAEIPDAVMLRRAIVPKRERARAPFEPDLIFRACELCKQMCQ